MQKASLFQRAREGVARFVGGSRGQQYRRFEAAKLNRLSADWLATEQSINQELRSDLNRLRARGRDLAKNNDYAIKFRGLCTDNIIGPHGIRLQVRIEDSPGKPDGLANDAIEAGWAEWSKVCDVTGQQSLRDFCVTLIDGMPSDGEFLVRMVSGPEAGNKFNFALQAIDVDRIDTDYNTNHGPGGNAVIMGVEVNAQRRPVALHIFVAHPNDGMTGSRMRMRVPMEDMIHGFKVERAEQVRGIPWMSAGMISLHHLSKFMMSALLAAEHGANHYGFFTAPDGGPPIGSTDASTGLTITTTQPGYYDTLPNGTVYTPHDSKYPNEVFGPFVKTIQQRIASGWRVAYHSLFNDLEGVNYSSIRSGSLEERDRWEGDQQWFVNIFMERVQARWLQMSLLSGAITFPNGNALPYAKRDKFSKHDWQPRRWEWVDPLNDMQSKILAVKAGLMAPQDLSDAMGFDFEDTLKAIARAQKLADDLGVKLTAYDPTPGAQTAGQQAQSATAGRTDGTKELDRHQLTMDLLGAAIKGLSRDQVAPVIQLPTQQLNISTRQIDDAVQAGIATIATAHADKIRAIEDAMQVTINVPEQPAAQITVNVEAPTVNVEATMPQAQVTVIDNHPVRAVQVVERDEDDEIKRTVTTFEK